MLRAVSGPRLHDIRGKKTPPDQAVAGKCKEIPDIYQGVSQSPAREEPHGAKPQHPEAGYFISSLSFL